MSTYSMTSDDLIASVKRRAFIPQTQSTFKNVDFLAFASEEMDVGIIPTILRMHEDYYLYTSSTPIEPNKTRYTVPYRAIGNKLRDVAFQDQNGQIYEMTRIGVDDLPFYQNYNNTSRPYAYYIESNEICLVPGNYSSSSCYLKTSYYMRPNSMVMLDEVAVITSIDRNTGVIQVSNIPENFNVSELLDLIQVKSPNKLLGFDIAPTAINSTSKTITFATADIPESLAVGDHVSLATESAMVQAPSDLHVILAHRVAQRCLEALGDLEGLATASKKLEEMNQAAEALIDNRVESSQRKIVNRHGTIRGGLLNKRRIRGY